MLSVRLPLPLFRPAFARSLVKLVNRRNPDAPKPPRSAFAFFLNQQYPAITKEMGEGHSVRATGLGTHPSPAIAVQCQDADLGACTGA